MQTYKENLNDLIEALKISSAYRQQQEHFWRQKDVKDFVPVAKEDVCEKVAQWH